MICYFRQIVNEEVLSSPSVAFLSRMEYRNQNWDQLLHKGPLFLTALPFLRGSKIEVNNKLINYFNNIIIV